MLSKATLHAAVFFILAAATLLLVLAGIGYLLPREWTARQSIDLAVTSPKVVEELVAAPENWPQWTPWNPRDLPGFAIRSKGESQVEWSSPELGHVRWEREESSRPLSNAPLRYRLVFEDADRATVHGTMTLEAVRGDGEVWRLTWTQRGPLRSDPLSRWVGLLVVRSLAEGDMKAALTTLKERLERTAPSRHAGREEGHH